MVSSSRDSNSSQSRSRTRSPVKTKDNVSNQNQSNNSNKTSESDVISNSKGKSKSQSVTRNYSRSESKSYSRSRSRSRNKKSEKKEVRERSRKQTRRSKSRDSSRSSRSRDRHSKCRSRHRDRRGRRYSRSCSKSPSPYYRRMNPSPCRVLGVFGLNFKTEERDLKRVFEKYGRLDKVKLVTDPRTGRSRGFAFVYFQYVEDAEEAKDRIHGQEIDGNHVRVEFSISNREHNPTPGVYMGRRTNARYDDYYQNKRAYSRSRSRRRSYSKD